MSIRNLILAYAGNWNYSDVEADTFSKMRLRDLGVDSLSMVELISDIERTFEIVISDSEFIEVETVEDIILLLKKNGHDSL